jgi:hypothetical protein
LVPLIEAGIGWQSMVTGTLLSIILAGSGASKARTIKNNNHFTSLSASILIRLLFPGFFGGSTRV